MYPLVELNDSVMLLIQNHINPIFRFWSSITYKYLLLMKMVNYRKDNKYNCNICTNINIKKLISKNIIVIYAQISTLRNSYINKWCRSQEGTRIFQCDICKSMSQFKKNENVNSMLVNDVLLYTMIQKTWRNTNLYSGTSTVVPALMKI